MSEWEREGKCFFLGLMQILLVNVNIVFFCFCFVFYVNRSSSGNKETQDSDELTQRMPYVKQNLIKSYSPISFRCGRQHPSIEVRNIRTSLFPHRRHWRFRLSTGIDIQRHTPPARGHRFDWMLTFDRSNYQNDSLYTIWSRGLDPEQEKIFKELFFFNE